MAFGVIRVAIKQTCCAGLVRILDAVMTVFWHLDDWLVSRAASLFIRRDVLFELTLIDTV